MLYDLYRTRGEADNGDTEQIGQVEALNADDALRIAKDRFRFPPGYEIWVDVADMRLNAAEWATGEIDVGRLAG